MQYDFVEKVLTTPYLSVIILLNKYFGKPVEKQGHKAWCLRHLL